MRLKNFAAAMACLAVLAGSTVLAKDAKTKASPKELVPTLAPPTAEWPEFPPITKPDTSVRAAASTPATTATTTANTAAPSSESSLSTGSSTAADVSTAAAGSISASVSTPAGSSTTPEGSSTPLSPAASTLEASATPLTPAQMEPHKRPVPPGYDAAANLYKQKKFPQAGKAFEAIIQQGAANVDTHLSLAYCYLLQRLYSKAAKEFEWVEKYGKNSMTLQKQAGRTAISLRTMISGVCPAPCLKANDPRWHIGNDGRKWITIRYSTSKPAWDFSEYHVGEYVANENGLPVLKGKCPVCDGTGRVARLKDGDPPPRL